jgi:hypothetical protein
MIDLNVSARRGDEAGRPPSGGTYFFGCIALKESRRLAGQPERGVCRVNRQ